MRVTEIMTPDVLTVAPETPINEVARLMSSRGVSGLPVVDPATGELVGLITELDMIARQAEFEEPVYFRFFDALFVNQQQDGEERLARILATRADQLMERTVYSIREDATVEEIATLMFERKVNPVPVLSLDNQLVGIVSRSDIIRLMARDFSEPGAYDEDGDGIDDPAPAATAPAEAKAQEPVATMPAETAPVTPEGSSGYRLVATSDDFMDRDPPRREGARE